MAFLTPPDTRIELASRIAIGEPREAALSHDLNYLKQEVLTIKNKVDALSNVPEGAPVVAKLKELEVKLISTDEKLSSIRREIMQSPEKALEIPMLRRDIQALQSQYDNATKSLEREISRTYDTVKWVMGTIVLGLLGLATSIFFRGRQ